MAVDLVGGDVDGFLALLLLASPIGSRHKGHRLVPHTYPTLLNTVVLGKRGAPDPRLGWPSFLYGGGLEKTLHKASPEFPRTLVLLPWKSRTSW
jgi:hypothetical protein